MHEHDEDEDLAQEPGRHRLINGLAFTFYGLAVLGAIAGQVQVAVDRLPWPPSWPSWLVILVAVAPVSVIELLGVVTAGMADWRRRLGEEAYGVLLFSGLTAAVATGINVFGHWGNLYASLGFGLLSACAYVLYLFHSAFRRRDALRARKALAKPAPIYGWAQWRKEPVVTRRAKSLAQAHDLGLHESLRMARDELRAETRLAALAKLVERRIRQEHADPVSAAIAANTYDLARLAAEIEARADYAGWADVIGQTLQPAKLAIGGNRRSANLADEARLAVTNLAEDETDAKLVRQVGGNRRPEGGPEVPSPRRTTGRRAPDSDERRKAREMYLGSLATAEPLSAARLADHFGRGRSWGRDRIEEVRQGVTDTGEFPIITDDMTREDAQR